MIRTLSAKTREEALENVLMQMRGTHIYTPLGYILTDCKCSCCLYESFNLVCKVGNEYKLFCYEGYIEHLKNCKYIRCTCNQPFKWNNVCCEEKIITYELMDELHNYTNTTEGILCDWISDIHQSLELQQENIDIYNYNESDKDEDDFFGDKQQSRLKNKTYYFGY